MTYQLILAGSSAGLLLLAACAPAHESGRIATQPSTDQIDQATTGILNNSGATAPGAQDRPHAPGDSHDVLVLASDDGRWVIHQRTHVAKPLLLPRRRNARPGVGALFFDVLAEDGSVLYRGRSQDPTTVRAVLAADSGEQSHHQVAVPKDAATIVRIPSLATATSIRLELRRGNSSISLGSVALPRWVGADRTFDSGEVDSTLPRHDGTQP